MAFSDARKEWTDANEWTPSNPSRAQERPVEERIDHAAAAREWWLWREAGFKSLGERELRQALELGDTLARSLEALLTEHSAREEREDWMRKQLDGLIESADAVAAATGLATARAVAGDLKDARSAIGESS